jgi:hypothetical protein
MYLSSSSSLLPSSTQRLRLQQNNQTIDSLHFARELALQDAQLLVELTHVPDQTREVAGVRLGVCGRGRGSSVRDVLSVD